MVRRGSPVRVRQRASRKVLQIEQLFCPARKRLSRAGIRGRELVFPHSTDRHTEFGLFKRIRTGLTPSVPMSVTRNMRRAGARASNRLANPAALGASA